MLRRVAGALALLLVTLSLAACGGSRGDLEKWVAEVKARPAPALEPLPTMQQFETFEYTAQNMRDPFDQTFTGEGAGGPRPDPGRRKQTLEMFSLDSLKMVGSLGTGKNLVALVMAPDKVTYRVKPGDYMGQSDGRVTGVFEDRIELVELVPDGAGGWPERPAKMALDN
ncbi:pilus assembly protein PilP [Thermomonas sp. S9]|uniref:pilus assembly protein PilP n=1 Tax=Thermomonas sp. S9 TaxID=2885203 RepID=UPI00216B0528|nr:pilus assembly protein PilP [Thermomonas sp. S9]MCR6497321.1 pilus assembly protein PilP [Thermomonas sp. S9]